MQGTRQRIEIVPETRLITTISSGLQIEATTSPDDPLLSGFYQGYDRAFVLPNEKEELGGFVQCLALNDGAPYRQLSGRYGPFREVILVAREPGDRAQLGGANFIAYPIPGKDILALNLNYIFVLPEHRRKGYFGRLVEGIGEIARAFFVHCQESTRVLIFIEQNDPLRMSSASYERDTGHAGLDQVDRIRIWAKFGARIVDFPYVQPALSEDQEPDDTLLYSVLGAHADSLDAAVLRDHLERFFAISVLKGKGLETAPTALSQIEALSALSQRGGTVPLLDPRRALAALTERRSVWADHPDGFRALAR